MVTVPIPSEIVIKASLREGAVFKMHRRDHREQAHFFVVLNNPVADGVIAIMVYATSKVEKRKAFNALTGIPSETLVEIQPGECAFLPLQSVFDCNNVLDYTVSVLIEKYKDGTLQLVNHTVSQQVLTKLKAAVFLSPVVERKKKRLIDS